MISCTEFIPAYSELFTYLEDKCGRGEVDKFWAYLFAPTGKGIPLVNHLLAEGIRGAYTYWSGSLNEEAADFTMYLNEKAGWFSLAMHRCPSKGRLLELRETIGITPYRDYCLHCDCYRYAVEKAGFKYIYDFRGIDRASCSILIYDPEIFDGRVIVDADTEIMDRRAGDNEYFHPDFHSSMNMGIHYIGEKFGEAGVREFLTRFAERVYRTDMERLGREGLTALEEMIKDTYLKEKRGEAVDFETDGGSLTVRVEYCPAVTHLKATGREVSPWFSYTSSVVMEMLAKAVGKSYKLISYNEENGASEYRFE